MKATLTYKCGHKKIVYFPNGHVDKMQSWKIDAAGSLCDACKLESNMKKSQTKGETMDKLRIIIADCISELKLNFASKAELIDIISNAVANKIRENFDLEPKKWTLYGDNGLLKKMGWWDIRLHRSSRENTTKIAIIKFDGSVAISSSSFSDLNSLSQSIHGELRLMLERINAEYKPGLVGLPEDFNEVANRLKPA